MSTARKKRWKSKARAKLVRYAPPRQLSMHARLLLLLTAMAASFVAYIFLGDFGDIRQQATAQAAQGIQPISELHYSPANLATASLREAFTIDGFQYEVRGAVNRGSAYGFQKAEGKFVEVVIAAENSGTAKATPHAIGMIDKDGTQYPQLPQFSLDGTRYSELMEHGMEPGAGTFFALFDVASDSTGLWLTFHARDGNAARIVRLDL